MTQGRDPDASAWSGSRTGVRVLRFRIRFEGQATFKVMKVVFLVYLSGCCTWLSFASSDGGRK